MCFKPKPKPPVTPPVVTPPVTSPTPLTIPHPEEPFNLNATVENTSVRPVLAEWMEVWEVPLASQPYLYNVIAVYIVATFPTWLAALMANPDGIPACKLNDPITGQVEIFTKPGWWNKGVSAHEVGGHPAYAQLTDDEKNAFEADYANVQSDPYIILLHSVNTYMNQLDSYGRHCEGHAELYRYLGSFIPDTLKKYYPGLF
jgi:hypothetical protein